VETPSGKTSWQTFDWMLRELNVVITAGQRIWLQRRRIFRISAFNSRSNAEEVARRFANVRQPTSNRGKQKVLTAGNTAKEHSLQLRKPRFRVYAINPFVSPALRHEILCFPFKWRLYRSSIAFASS
jgi:hypothetical protein